MSKAVKNIIVSIFVLFAFVLMPSFSFAERLATIKMPKFSYNKEDSTALLSFNVYNLDKSELDQYLPELRLIKVPENKEYARIRLNWDNLSFVPGKDYAEYSASVSINDVPKGQYQVMLVLVKDRLGIISLNKLAIIDIDKSNTEFFANLECSAKNPDVPYNNKIELTCKLVGNENDDLKLKYTIYSVGALKEIKSDIIPVSLDDNNTFAFDIPVDFEYSGTVDVGFVLLDKDNKALNSQYYIRYNIPGNFVDILSVKKDSAQTTITVKLNGTLYSPGRKILVGLLDQSGKICFAKEGSLKTVAPLTREYKYDNTKCPANATAFAIAYRGSKAAVEYLLDYEGIKNKSFALSILESYLNGKEKKLASSNSGLEFADNVLLYFIILSAVALIIFALALAVKKRYLLSIALLLFASSLAVGATKTQNIGTANPVAFSADAPKVKFLVNFLTVNNEVGKNDNIIFDLSALDNFSAMIQKFAGAEIYASLDGGNTQTLVMQATDNDPTVTVSLPHSLSLGAHTITFRSPDLCGSAYDFSVFDTAEFGTKDCVFTTPFTVVPSSSFVVLTANPLAVPQGDTTTLKWYVSSDMVSCSASGAWSGAKATNSVNTETSPQLTQAPKTYEFILTCQNNEGKSFYDNVFVTTYNCGDNMCTFGENCNNCSSDCGACVTYMLEIYANPKIVKYGNKTEITWKSRGYTSCEVTEDNDSINDHWTGLASRKLSSALVTDTSYTVTCTDGSKTDSKSVKVRVAPRWVEY